MTPGSALLIGTLAAGTSQAAMVLLQRTGLDDTLDVFACHGVAGIVGCLLTGVFATTAVNPDGADGLMAGAPALLGVQTLSVLAAVVFAAVGTLGILIVVSCLTPLRTSASAEHFGIDVVEHAERAYLRETGFTWIGQTGGGA